MSNITKIHFKVIMILNDSFWKNLYQIFTYVKNKLIEVPDRSFR